MITLAVFTNLAPLPNSLCLQHAPVALQYSAYPAQSNFANACNACAQNSAADWLLFLSPEVAADERLSGAIASLANTIAKLPDACGVLSLRQLPLEAGHHIDPITLAIQTFEPNAFAVRRTAFVAAGGFDPTFSLYLGYEFALRIQAAGYTLQYLPSVCVSVPNAYDRLAHPTLDDYCASLAEPLLLAAKYQGVAAITAAKFAFFAAIRTPKHYPSVRKRLVFALTSLIAPAFGRWFWRCGQVGRTLFAKARTLHAACPPTSIPQRGRVPQAVLSETPLVSVVVRTCGRPAVLAQTLTSLRHQTYPSFEVIVIEDGAPTAQETIATTFADLPIRYHATQTNVGRGRAGNLGIEKARGKYVCFLDDDDFYYPDYIEASVACLQEQDGVDFIYTPIMALEMEVTSRTPSYQYTLQKTHPILFDHLTLMDMCVKCRVPMSGGMFCRTLYSQVGGMREDIDADEDWAMWLRYSMVGQRKNPNGLDLPRTLSLCAFPADPTLATARHTAYEKFDFEMLSDPKLQFNVTAQDLTEWRAHVLRDVAHVKNMGTLSQLLAGREAWPRFTPNLDAIAQSGSIVLTALQINGYYQSILDAVTAEEI